ncbi:MAG: hypothetical protein SPK43_02250 [Candidatus Onthovivens sp.]|nr:hypothetical protein [Candidatus Onthovivens sp.]
MKLYKTKKKNEELLNGIRKLENIEKERGKKTGLYSLGWRHCTNEECISDTMYWINCSYEMAKKIVWFVRADNTRRNYIKNSFGKEYLYNCVP